MVIDHVLDNNYQFKNLKQSDIKSFSNFIKETVGKNLTITEVANLFLRTEHMTKQDQEEYDGHQLIHFGKDRNPFRIFGYYDDNDYFCIHRIDAKHNVHKQK